VSKYGQAASVLASAGVIAAGWSIGTADGQTLTASQPIATTTVTTTTTATATKTATKTATAASTQSATATQTSTGATGTFTGATSNNQYGSVTVTVTLSNGTITDVTADAAAGDGHSQRIVQQALPILRQEVLAAQSGDISTVGGATFTSDSYITSLQSALDQAA